ncbi:hypothetical protein [Intestinibacter sp.]|uniref:hypothetical protein n=1 Tax=Intestinibacter sp. TaxID=1965304 RepID=UPI003F18B309
MYIIGSTTGRTSNGYDYGWRFDVSNGWAYGNFSNSDTLDGYHASSLFTNLSNSENKISITIGGTNKTLTVDYAAKASMIYALNNSTAYCLLGASAGNTYTTA